MLNDRLTINTAAFWINWSNLQQTLRFSCGFSSLINSGKARSRGGEIEISALPIDNLTVTAGLGYTDARIISPGALLTVLHDGWDAIGPHDAIRAAQRTRFGSLWVQSLARAREIAEA